MPAFIPAVKNAEITLQRSVPDPQISSLGVFVAVGCVTAGIALAALLESTWPIAAGTIAGAYCLFAIKVAKQWQKAAVLRLGRFAGLRGPGVFHVIPIIDSLSRYVDQRVRVTDVTAESALTRD